jgi:hypothetical protein
MGRRRGWQSKPDLRVFNQRVDPGLNQVLNRAFERFLLATEPLGGFATLARRASR